MKIIAVILNAQKGYHWVCLNIKKKTNQRNFTFKGKIAKEAEMKDKFLYNTFNKNNGSYHGQFRLKLMIGLLCFSF